MDLSIERPGRIPQFLSFERTIDVAVLEGGGHARLSFHKGTVGLWEWTLGRRLVWTCSHVTTCSLLIVFSDLDAGIFNLTRKVKLKRKAHPESGTLGANKLEDAW